jgi:beta-lactamase regulating signal transducer with metallopeptidase domain
MTEQLLALLWQQAALMTAGILALAALRPLLKRLGAGAMYAAWLLLPLLALTPALPRPGIEPMRVVLQATGAAALPALTPPTLPSSGFAAAALTLWLGGTLLVLLWQAQRQWALSRLGTRLPAGSSPALVGLLRPHVALPADFEQRFTPAQRTLILAHESVHRARHDNFWNLVACSLWALHWWNPLAAWAVRRLRADQELACDAAVLGAHPQARLDYTRALLAAHDLHHLGAPLASRWGTHHPLVERIAMLNRPRSLSRRTGLALAAACLGFTGLAYAAQAMPGDAGGAAAPRKVEIRLTLTADGSTSTPRLITALGARSRIEWGPSPEKTWRLDLTVTQTPDGQLQVVTLPSYAGRPLGDHTGTLPSGESFGQRLGGQDGVPLLAITRVVSLLPADFQMPAPKAPAKPAAS